MTELLPSSGSSALLSVLASCGTSWAIWAGGDLVTLGVCRHLDGPVIGGSLRGGRCLSLPLIIVIVRGSCAFPGGAPKATLLDYMWLVDPHLVLVVRHSVVG